MNTNITLLEWQAPARLDHDRSERWYVVAGLLCATLIVYSVLTGAWSLAVTFGMLGGLAYITRNVKHKIHAIKILPTGIDVDGHLTIWSEWKHFWILQGDGYFELHVEPKSSLRPDLVLLTGDTDPFLLRDALGAFIPQIAHKREKIIDAITRYCKI
jgi:hypothetical protein